MHCSDDWPKIVFWYLLTLNSLKVMQLLPDLGLDVMSRSTQSCISPGLLNQVPALISWGKDGNVTSAGWQATLRDPIWHVSSRIGKARCELLYLVTYRLTT